MISFFSSFLFEYINLYHLSTKFDHLLIIHLFVLFFLYLFIKILIERGDLMDIDFHTNISESFKNIEVLLNAPSMNDEIKKLEHNLQLIINKSIQEILGLQGNNLFIINVKDIIMFYSEEKNNFCKTQTGTFKIREKLYLLEDLLPKSRFIRISNSIIININYVKCFNTDIIGKIIVNFKDGSKATVSRRRTSNIMKFLKNRGDYYETF